MKIGLYVCVVGSEKGKLVLSLIFINLNHIDMFYDWSWPFCNKANSQLSH